MSLKIYKPEDVVDAESFAAYAQQQLGVPYPTIKMMGMLKKRLREVKEQNPGFTEASLPRVVEWAKNRKKRFPDPVRLLSCFRYAFADGFLPELSERWEERTEIQDQINAALRVETDPEWRSALFLCDSVEEKVYIYRKWQEKRSHLFANVAS